MRILVTYTSRFGSTAKTATSIAGELQNQGFAAAAEPMAQIQSLNGYDAVIIGAPIHYDRWNSVAANFVGTRQNELAVLPHAFFFNCLTLSREDAQSKIQAQKYADAISALSPTRTLWPTGQFAGVLDYANFRFWQRPLVCILFFLLRVREGDHRDPDAIRAWALAGVRAFGNLQPKESL